MRGEGNGFLATAKSIFVVMEEVDGVLFEVPALVIVPDDHSDVFVPGHALHLAVGGKCPTK